MRIKQANPILFQALFLLMIFVSIMLDTKISLPFGTILRWVMPAMLLLAVVWTQKGRINLTNNLLYWLLIAVFAVAVFISPRLIYSAQRWVSFVLVTVTFMSYFFLMREQNTLYRSALVFGWLYVAYGVLNFLFLQWGQERPTGLTANANSLGHFSNLSFLFALLYYKKAETKAKQRWMLAVMAMSAVLVIMSASRSATIVLLLNVLAAAWLMNAKRLKIVLTLLVPVGILLLLLNVSFLEKIPGVGRLLEKDGIGADRELMWSYGTQLMKQKPWLGWGYGISVSLNILENASFHNSYLTVGIESGWIGMVALILFILCVLLKSMVSYKESKRIETLVLLMLAINKVIDFIGESSMTSVGSTEGVFFWGVMMWLLVESSGKDLPQSMSKSVANQ